jgi:hypothetical protein
VELAVGALHINRVTLLQQRMQQQQQQQQQQQM